MWAVENGTRIKTGKSMMGQLERQVEVMSGEFKAQNIANTL